MVVVFVVVFVVVVVVVVVVVAVRVVGVGLVVRLLASLSDAAPSCP
ncbi:MAG: hypothetical protein ACK55I_21755 [bacterium]